MNICARFFRHIDSMNVWKPLLTFHNGWGSLLKVTSIDHSSQSVPASPYNRGPHGTSSGYPSIKINV